MEVKKAYEITDAKIQFVSLVDKAANLKSFLITKADNGQANFSTCGRIVKKDAENHFVTGVVYEPLAEDAHGNFMTEEEITKAAYYFVKNGSKVDLQHSFEPMDGAAVVESWIAKSDFDVDGETIKKGTWLMTVEISDEEIWKAVENGDLTGFSMGGVGNYSKEDVDLEAVEKTVETPAQDEQTEKKGLFKKLGEMLGFEMVEKGAVAEKYERTLKSDSFWDAFYALQNTLLRYDWNSDTSVFEEDEATIREALDEFSQIITGILTSTSVVKALGEHSKPIEKAGKKMSKANKEKLQGICDSLTAFMAQFEEAEDDDDNQEGDGTVTKSTESAAPAVENNNEEETDMTKAEVQEMVNTAVTEAVQKALAETEPAAPASPAEEPITKEAVQEMVTEAVATAVAEIRKQRGVPTAINDDGSNQQPVEKQHYLHGII